MRRVIIILSCLCLLSACSSHKNDPQYIELKPEDTAKAAQLNTRLAMGYLEQGNSTRAKVKILLAMSQDAKSATVNGGMAYYHEVTGDEERADYYYRQAMRYAPNKGNELNNYGAFLCRQGKYDQAEKYFNKAVKDHDYIATASAFENAGLCAQTAKQANKAMDYFKKAIEKDHSRGKSLYQIAKLYYQQEEYSLAERYLDRYHRVEPATREATELARNIALKLNNHKKAEALAMQLQTKFAVVKPS